jgi:putative ABC transport system permease protein
MIIETLWQDLRYGWRMLVRHPGFALVAILTLALGIGANTAIFSVVNAVLLRPLSYASPDELVAIWESRPGRERETATPANFLDWRERNDVFAALAAFGPASFTLTEGGEPEQLRGASVSHNFFALLDSRPALGRTFEQGEADPLSVIISHALWQRRFGSDQSIVGRRIRLNDRPYTILGVMPPQFNFLFLSPMRTSARDATEFWVPAPRLDVPALGGSADFDLDRFRRASYLRVIGRLKPGVSLAQAQSAMEGIAAQLAVEHPDTNRDYGVRLVPLHRQIVGDRRPALLALLAAVGCVLLVACANVANLLLVRGAARQKEIAIRAALGAGRRRIARQLLTESLLLALASGALALLMAAWSLDLLVRFGPSELPRLAEVSIDRWVLGFTLLVSILTGLAFGAWPAWKSSRTDLNESIKGGAAPGGRRLLVVAEVALSVLLLIGAGLLLRSFLRLQSSDPGFDPARLVTFSLNLPGSRYPRPETQAEFYRRALERIRALPGVEAAGATINLPIRGDEITFGILFEGRPEPAPSERESVGYQAASPDYFETLRIPVRRGREFNQSDTINAPGVALINETAARRYFSGVDPLGQRIKLGGHNRPWLTIVGIVADVRHGGLGAEPRPEGYACALQSPFSFTDVVVRTKGDPRAVFADLRSIIGGLDPALPLTRVMTMEDQIAASVAQPRFTMALATLFGAIAMLLAAIGLYGVMAYTVSRRTREIGIRLALGAQPHQVLRMILAEGLSLTALGVAAGILSALALGRLATSFLYGISGTDQLTYAAVAALIFAVTALACYVPARRAMRIDPLTALRLE